VNLDRPEVTRAFREFAASGHGVLIGAPGVGKTYLLRALVHELQAAPDSECLFMPVDRMPFESDADLRAELDVTGDIVSFFESQTQQRHGYLIVDALDAVRGDRPRAYVLSLVRRVLARLYDSWTVILSMRTYDALRSVELDEIFAPASHAAPEPMYQMPGAVCRHFYVPPLNDGDIDAAKTQLAWLQALWDGGHDDLRELLRIPFNLWLLERLFAGGTTVAEISPVHSEVQLLNLFWRQRVRSGPLEPDQRHLASRAADAMVRQRTLWAQRNDVYEAGANEAWRKLHSSEVLQDANDAGTRVSFGHNVLFDYAVSVEVLDDDAGSLGGFLRQEPDRALFLRPTLNYFFARLWFTNRPLFWEIFWTLLAAEEPQVRLVAQVLSPGIVAREARSLDDVEPILSRLESDADHSEDAVLRVLQAIRTHEIANDGVWSAFAARAARRASRVYSWNLARFLSELLEREQQRSAPNAAIREHVSVGARSLLRLALASHDPALEHLAAAWLVGVVARTYDEEPADARALFVMIVSRIADPNTPVDLIYRLANAVQDFWNEDPELAASIYAATFTHVELSEESTHMGGIVLALSSTRRQDFGLAQYVLLEAAPRFLRTQPPVALRALVQAATGAAVAQEHLPEAGPEESFDFRGKRVRYRQDNSHFWDAPGTVQDDAQKLVETILAYLAELPTGSTALAQGVDVIAQAAASAFIWRSLLKAGARDTAKYTPLLYELLSAEPVLSHPETAPEAAAFLAVAAPLLDDSNLLRVENAVVDLAAQDRERTRHWAKRLAVQIPEGRLATDAARELRAEALADPEASSNRPLVSFSTSFGRYNTEDWLRDEGVETDTPTNKILLTATDGLQEFVSRYVNEQAVPKDAIATVVSALGEALELLQSEASPPTALLDTVWARIGDAAAVAARSEALDERAVGVLRRALLACASGDAPRPAENADEAFTVPAWSPAARNAAAEGLPRLLQHRTDDDEMVAALRSLTTDPAPSVRYLLARELPRLVSEHEDSFWEFAGLYAAKERNRVVQQALGRALMAVVVSSPDREERVTQTLDQLLQRVPLADTERSLPNEDQVGGLIVGLAVARRNEWAIARLDEALRGIPPPYLSTLVFHLLHFIGYKWIADPKRRGMAQAALGWLPQIIERVHRSLRDEVDRAQAGDSDRGEAIRELFEVLEHIISRFYFQSGIHEGQTGQHAAREEICEFFGTIRPILRQLGEITGGTSGLGLPARTAHHLIQLLRGCIACDPAEVLHLTRLAIDGAQGGGYAFDPMAAQEVTAIVETMLADHREAVRSAQPLDDLMRVLDAFVQAGWPEAQRLVWRLEELFR
jgi:hypothetical protein